MCVLEFFLVLLSRKRFTLPCAYYFVLLISNLAFCSNWFWWQQGFISVDLSYASYCSLFIVLKFYLSCYIYFGSVPKLMSTLVKFNLKVKQLCFGKKNFNLAISVTKFMRNRAAFELVIESLLCCCLLKSFLIWLLSLLTLINYTNIRQRMFKFKYLWINYLSGKLYYCINLDALLMHNNSICSYTFLTLLCAICLIYFTN